MVLKVRSSFLLSYKSLTTCYPRLLSFFSSGFGRSTTVIILMLGEALQFLSRMGFMEIFLSEK